MKLDSLISKIVNYSRNEHGVNVSKDCPTLFSRGRLDLFGPLCHLCPQFSSEFGLKRKRVNFVYSTCQTDAGKYDYKP